MKIGPTRKQWVLLALVAAAVGLLIRWLWKRRSEPGS